MIRLISRRRHVVVVTVMALMAALNMAGWSDRTLLPPDDFAGYVTAVDDARGSLLQHGNVPRWSTKWFAGSSRFMSVFKELVAFPLAVGLGPLRGTQVAVFLLKILAGTGMYFLFARMFASPAIGVVAGYAYAFSMVANYSSDNFGVTLSYALVPIVVMSMIGLLRERRVGWAVACGVTLACQLTTSYVHAISCSLLAILLLVFRPWRSGPRDECPFGPSGVVWRRGWLVGIAGGVFLLFGGAQMAWLMADAGNHALHDPEHVERWVQQFIEHSPFVYINRGNWLGPWLERHHPPGMQLFPEEPLLNQRHYLGVVGMLTCLAAWRWARADYTLRRWYQVWSLFFGVQWWLSMGPRTLAWETARTFGWPEWLDDPLRTVLRVAAMACAGVGVLVGVRARERLRIAAVPRMELAFGLGGALFFASHSLFDMARASVPGFSGMRSPGHFFELTPFPLACLLGTAMMAIARGVAGARRRAVLGGVLFVLVVLDFWPGRAAFRRGIPATPIAEFREQVMRRLPRDETLRLTLIPWYSPTSWVAGSWVASGAAVGGAWSWLPWQAGRHWPAYLKAATLWLAEDLDPGDRERLRPVSNALGRIGRIKYVLDEFDDEPGYRLEDPWILRARNERFALWERPDVMPMATAYRAHVVVVDDDTLATALAASEASRRNAVVLSMRTPLSEAAGGLIEGAAAVVVGDAMGGRSERAMIRRRQGRTAVTAESLMPPGRRLWPLEQQPIRPLVDVRYRRRAPDRIELHVAADTVGDSGAVVFVAEAYHPWWRATANGRPADVLRAQVAFMAVPIGPVDRTVDLRFSPPFVVLAADTVTAGSWAVLGLASAVYGAWMLTRQRRRREDDP